MSECRAASAIATPPSPLPAWSTRRGRTSLTSRSSAWNSGSRARRSIILRVLRPSIMRMRFSISLSAMRQRRRVYCSSWAAM
jgi:hypothetical protein